MKLILQFESMYLFIVKFQLAKYFYHDHFTVCYLSSSSKTQQLAEVELVDSIDLLECLGCYNQLDIVFLMHRMYFINEKLVMDIHLQQCLLVQLVLLQRQVSQYKIFGQLVQKLQSQFQGLQVVIQQSYPLHHLHRQKPINRDVLHSFGEDHQVGFFQNKVQQGLLLELHIQYFVNHDYPHLHDAHGHHDHDDDHSILYEKMQEWIRIEEEVKFEASGICTQSISKKYAKQIVVKGQYIKICSGHLTLEIQNSNNKQQIIVNSTVSSYDQHYRIA